MPGMLCAPVMRGRPIASHVPSAPQHAFGVIRKTARPMEGHGVFAVSGRLTFSAAQQKEGPGFSKRRLTI